MKFKKIIILNFNKFSNTFDYILHIYSKKKSFKFINFRKKKKKINIIKKFCIKSFSNYYKNNF